jgi:D-amino peptidase
VKIFISSDIEGTAGIVDWEQVRGPGAEYEIGRQLLADEVNAAIDGAVQAGATHVLVNDAHRTMYNPAAIWDARLNGVAVGESGLNALIALHHQVPVVLITGDDATAEEARPFLPGIEAVVVKRSVTRFAAESLHPERSCELIRAGAARALARVGAVPPPAIDLPATLELTFLTADMAEMATWVRGVQRVSARTITATDDDPLRLYRTFVTIIALTRSIVDR